jgi:hypothetical protein
MTAALLAALALGLGSAPSAATPQVNRCRPVSAGLQKVLTSALAFPSGGTIADARRVTPLKRKNLYFVSAFISSPDLGDKRVLATWVTNRLDGTATIGSLNVGAKSYSDWQPAQKVFPKVTMATEGARVSQRCATAAAKG